MDNNIDLSQVKWDDAPPSGGMDLSQVKWDNEESSSTPPRKKSIWSALGAEITPQMREQHPVLSGIAQTGQDIVSMPADFINQGLLNYPRASLNKAGYEYPEAESPVSKGIQKAGGVAGGVLGGAKVAGGLRMAGAKGLELVGKSGVAAAAYADTERPFDPMQKATQFGLGAGTGGIFAAAGKAKQALDKAKGTEFLRKVRGAVFNRKREVVDKFGDDLDGLANSRPDQSVSIRTSLEKIGVEINGGQFGEVVVPSNPKIASIVNRSPTLKKYIDNPELADNVTLRESQAIINELKNKLPAMKKNGFNVNSDDIPLFDLIDDMRYDQLQAFPEMAQVRQQYGKMMSKYNLIKYKIREGSLKKQLIDDFGDPEIKEAFDGMITQDIMKEIRGYKQTNKMLKMMGLAAKTMTGAAIGGAGAKIGYGLLQK